MRVLIVKTSSIGDVIHCLPALSDAVAARPDIEFDWVIEKGLREICDWHPAIRRAITVNYRHWRRHPVQGIRGGHFGKFRRKLGEGSYDLVIDAQGLYKSAVITAMSPGEKHGFDLASCREKLAPLAYHQRHRVPRNLHAVERLRLLFAKALGYSRPERPAVYGIEKSRLPMIDQENPYIVFLHGTAWRTKRWPVEQWRALARRGLDEGYRIILPWQSDADRLRAEAISCGLEGVLALHSADLSMAAGLIAGAAGVVAVDTGLGHLAAALGKPAVSLYGPTGPELTGTLGEFQSHFRSALPCSPCRNKICNYTGNLYRSAPCLQRMEEAEVWQRLQASPVASTRPS